MSGAGSDRLDEQRALAQIFGPTFALAEAQILLAAPLSRFAIALTDRRPAGRDSDDGPEL